MDLELVDSDRLLFVAGIPDNIKEGELVSIFSTFGEIRAVRIPREMTTGKQRGFAFVEFDDADDAEHAIMNYNNTEIMGKVIKVKKSQPKQRAPFGKAIWHEEEEKRKEEEEAKKEEEENLKQQEEFKKSRHSNNNKDGKKDNKKKQFI